jgi:predicted phosphodiesterase
MEHLEWFKIAKELREKNPDISYSEIARQLNMNVNTVKSQFLRDSKRKNDIEFIDKKDIPTFEDINEYYNKLKELEEKSNTLDIKQTKTTLRFDSDKPLAIAFWGDWHLGSHGIDYEQFDKDRKLIKETNGLYFIGMGDYKDNNSAYVHKSTNENSIPQGVQDKLVLNFMEEVGSKNIVTIRGCHDDWDKKIADKDFISEICERINSVNLWHGGTITILLGQEQYKIFARHKYKYESSLNTTNAQRNMLNDIGPVDVVALAHKHYPDLQMLDRMGSKVVYLRSGSYKKYDEFGQKLAGYEGKKSIPIVVIFPKEHKIVPFSELEDGITYLKAVRGE